MKIDHVALFVMDLESVKTFFETYFGAKSNELYHNPKTGLKTYILSFEMGDARLELMQRPDVAEVVPVTRLGFIHLSMAVGSKPSVDELTFRLKTAGYEVLSGPRTTGDGYYESSVLGPENIQLEITV